MTPCTTMRSLCILLVLLLLTPRLRFGLKHHAMDGDQWTWVTVCVHEPSMGFMHAAAA
jgi:hypothetical protein